MSSDNEDKTQNLTFAVPIKIAREFLLYCPEKERNAEVIKLISSLVEEYKKDAIEKLVSQCPLVEEYELNSVEVVRRLRGR